ncbi:MAG TPA: serine hydrolase domain-containing protein [Caulobacteraceae bacterium]|nr:serine hydrolase domain-containing protein [Caulobacteraceae bacterium]
MSLHTIQAALAAAPQAARVPGYVAVARDGDGGEAVAVHGRRKADDPAPMTADTVFWIASMTKLVTSIAALQLVEEGVLALDQPVAEVRPEFADLPILEGFDAAGAPRLRAATDAPTVRHLLTHTSGLGYAFMDADLARYAEQAAVAPGQGHLLPRRFEAGARWQYGTSTDWVGAIVETLAGKGLAEVLERRILGPLGMTDTSFAPTPDQQARKAAMHARQPDGGLSPMDFAMPAPPYFAMGGGGLYSTGPDFMKLLAAILDGAILSPASRASLFANHAGDLDCGVLVSSNPAFTRDFDPAPGHAKRWSLGLMVNPNPGPDGRAAGSGAWAGLGNCYYWLDPSAGVAGVLLTQILPFADPDVLALFQVLERAVYG